MYHNTFSRFWLIQMVRSISPVVLLKLNTALLLMPTMPGMGLTLSPDPTPVLIFSSAFITTIVSTTDYTLIK